MRISFLILIYLTFVAFTPSVKEENRTVMPRVFIIGEYEEEYNLLQEKYRTSLLEICDDDMMLAFGKLTTMYEEMEAYAEQIGYEVGGVRLWIHAFWSEQGEIEYLGFHLRPNSRKVESEDIETFLLGFVNQYRFPLITDQKYTQYTSVSFPTFSKRLYRP